MSGATDPAAIRQLMQNNGQRFVDDLMIKCRRIDDGTPRMTILKDMHWHNGFLTDLVVRACTVPFWRACIEVVEDRAHRPSRRVCAVGSPGIGKTTSTVVLIYMLLRDEKTVLYHPRGSDCIFEFGCQKDLPATTSGTPTFTCTCTVHDEGIFPTGIPSTFDEKAYYIVDPTASKGDFNPPYTIGFKAKVIIVSSPNDVHWGGANFMKQRYNDVVPVSGGILLYYPLWTLDEMLEGLDGLNVTSRTNLQAEEVKRRYTVVGGVPRHVFCDEGGYKEVIRVQHSALAHLSAERAQKFAMGLDSPVGSLTNDQPKSALLGFDQHESFQMKTCLVSWTVRRLAYEIHLSAVWESIFNVSYKGPAFEDYTWLLMVGDETRSFEMRPLAKDGEKSRKKLKPADIELGGCIVMKKSSNIVTSAQEEPGVLFRPNSQQNPFIDFAYAMVNDEDELHVHAFQSSVGATHTAAGIAGFDEALFNNVETTTVYFLVPEFRYEKVATNPPTPRTRNARIDFKVVKIPPPGR